MLKVWNVGLVTATFALTILGTFVTRSGIIESVHAFASTNIGWVFLGFLVIVIGATIALTWWRTDLLKSENRIESWASRETAFLFNNLLLVGIAFAIWWGTFFPFVSEVATGERVSVGPPFFNQVNGPLSLGLLLVLGIGPVIAWRRASRANVARNFRLPLAVLFASVPVAWFIGIHAWYAVGVVAFSAFVLATIVQEFWRGMRARMRSKGEGAARALVRLVAKNRRRYGGYIVHIGVLFVFAGVAGTLFVQERSVRLLPGETTRLEGLDVLYRGTDLEQGPNYTATVANLTISEKGGRPYRMRPERRFYPEGQEQTTTEVAIWSRPFDDIYAILERYDPTSRAADLTLLVNPMVQWIWLGGAIMVLGTLLALSSPRPGVRRGRRDAKEAAEAVEA